MIIVEKLIKSYHSKRVLHGIDHRQQPSETVVLIGQAAAAKPLFFGALTSLRCPTLADND